MELCVFNRIKKMASWLTRGGTDVETVAIIVFCVVAAVVIIVVPLVLRG